MARHLRCALAQVKVRISQQLTVDVDQLARDVGHDWRERLLSPAVTVRLFLVQILHGNVAINALPYVDAMSGAVVTALGCPLFTHEAREMIALHALLRFGDILVADRGFCSYAQIAFLMQHGVDAVMRLHQRRPVRWMKDYLEVWTRPIK